MKSPFAKGLGRTLAAFACLLAGLLPRAGQAQAYPDRPIRIINGFAAGGGADLLVRAIQPKATELLGQQIIIDYKAGAGGNLAMESVAHAAPDGYTLLLGTPGLAINPSLYKSLTFDPLKDFSPITMIGVVQNVLVVNPSIPARNVQELIALLRAQPGKLNFGSSGYGTSLHLAGELFKLSTDTDIVHVAYKGSGQAINDVMGGQVEMMFNVLPSSLPFIRDGRLRALAVTGSTRAASLPEVPTMMEAGVRDYQATTWNGILAPANTPHAIVDRLNNAFVEAIKSREVLEAFEKIGQDPLTSTPEEFAAFLKAESAKWARVIDKAHIQAP
jgi:tripartite-type tricarboxylate transporter receptor subunit TctC